ncbi:ComF family protein [Candidatus Neomarinimicrobiota bacterium]
MMPVTVHLPNPLDLLFPPLCALCTTPLSGEDAICSPCLDALLPTGLGQWLDDIFIGEGLDGVWSAFWYDETMESMIHLFKYGGHSRIGHHLSEAMYTQLDGDIPWYRFDTLVPVPLHRTKRRERGYNQSAILARTLGQLTGLPVNERLLERYRWTRSQTGLSVQERRTNMDDSFRAAEMGDNRKVLLVDDVLTTGATASACARAIKVVDVEKVAVLTLATPLKEK